MAVFTKLRTMVHQHAVNSSPDENVGVAMSQPSAPVAGQQDVDAITPAGADHVLAAEDNAGKPDANTVDQDVQQGVQNQQAITLSWSKWSLAAVLFNIWMLYFINSFQSSILSNLLPFITSAYQTHALLNVVYVISNAMTASVYIPLSKILDVWGRAEGFAIMTVFATVGLIMMAACNGLPTFCAAYVFYSIGFGGMTYCVDVITADVSTLRNRGLAYAFTSSPNMITAFAGPKAADDFYYHVNWRWGFGCFSIIFPFVAMPLFFILKSSLRKAERFGFAAQPNSNRTLLQSIWFYALEFDIFGVVLFSAGLTIFYLPFDLAALAPNGWGSDYIIAMIVVGFVLLCFFAVYEWKIAPSPMYRFSLLKDRTVIGACLIDFTYQISYYCWNNYFTSFLQAVNGLTLAQAGYVSHTFDVVSGVLLLFVGFLIRKTGRFKWLLYIAVPMYILAQGLMIYFRRPNQSVGYLVMCQVFISVGGSIFIIIEQLSILAAVDHQHVATALALLNVVGTFGGATGSTISGAIWTNTFEKALSWYLPEETLPDLATIYENLSTQLSYPKGDPTRIAIQHAYGYAQTRMLAAGTGIMALCFVWMLFVRNYDLRKMFQVKGVVF